MGLRSAIGPLLSTPQRRAVLIALTSAYMLVQLSSLPVALALPSLADYFDTGLDEAAWLVIIYLLALGSFVLLGARLGDRYGHARVFFVGLIFATAASVLIATSTSLLQVIIWRGVTGLGSALVMGNANAILAGVFPAEERGRAFSIPIVGARFGTLAGLALFGFFLTFLSWRLVFFSFLPLGIIALVLSYPMLKSLKHEKPVNPGRIDILGAVLLIGTAAVLILSGNHLHGGEETFVSNEGLGYHLPMHGLFIVMLGVFILVERKISSPIVELHHFKNKYFSMALISNTTYHLSMLATMTMVPILVERGFGMAPLWVAVVLLPNQIMGMIMPFAAGWIYDRYQPKLLRPGAMIAIAGGFLILGTFAGSVPIWGLPLLMLPISIGTSIFNPINNAAVMSSLSGDARGFASGMLETTREMGHALGATLSATALAMALPVGIVLLSDLEAQPFYVQGFQLASMLVVLTLLAGGVIAYFHKTSAQIMSASPAAASASAGGDD
ncbi:MAG: MFS transporter [Chloroflexi bacterium]|nr:MFS transporter [Chloroflexota bacterium]MDA1227057.1 MFS transporter [Chloroflexota bacterium]